MTFRAPERWDAGDFVIRCYLPGDGAALNEATLASYEHIKPWMPWATSSQTVDEAEDLARTFRADFLTGENFVMGVWDREESVLLGGTGFHLRGGPLEAAQPETGMWVRPERAGSGLGTAMLGAMLRWGFSDWPWLRIEWRADSRNMASRRVAEKCGLRLEGTLRGVFDDVSRGRRDTCIYAILRDD